MPAYVIDPGRVWFAGERNTGRQDPKGLFGGDGGVRGLCRPQLPLGGVGELLGGVQVDDHGVVADQGVAAAAAVDPAGPEAVPQPADQGGDSAFGSLRSVTIPEQLDELVDTDESALTNGQDLQQPDRPTTGNRRVE